MRFDYLTDDTEKSLVPFFAPTMLSITFNCVLIFGLLLLVFWPYKELFDFIRGHRIPLTFLGVFAGTLLISSYVNLACGRGEIFPRDLFSRMIREGVITLEEKYNFLSYGLVQSILHNIFFIFLAFPLLMLSATISGISLQVFAQALSILFTAPLLCRLVSFLIYLLFGRRSLVGFILAKLFFVFFFFATGAFAAFANPILLIYAFHSGEEILTGFQINSYSLYIMLVTSAILILTLINNAIIRHNIPKERSA